jgi:hypothetical protein
MVNPDTDLVKDAERYRWLREQLAWFGGYDHGFKEAEELDAAIDAARKEEGK